MSDGGTPKIIYLGREQERGNIWQVVSRDPHKA